MIVTIRGWFSTCHLMVKSLLKERRDLSAYAEVLLGFNSQRGLPFRRIQVRIGNGVR